MERRYLSSLGTWLMNYYLYASKGINNKRGVIEKSILILNFLLHKK
jgi:hypothetical protein